MMLLGRLGIFTEYFIPLGDVLWGRFCSGVLCWASFVRRLSTGGSGAISVSLDVAVSKKVPKFFFPCPHLLCSGLPRGAFSITPHHMCSSAIGKQLSVQLAQRVQCLPHKHKDPSSIPWNSCLKVLSWLHAPVTPVLGKGETGSWDSLSRKPR